MNEDEKDCPKQLTIRDLKKMRETGEKFCNTTACDCNTARMVDEAGIEIIGAGGAFVMLQMELDISGI